MKPWKDGLFYEEVQPNGMIRTYRKGPDAVEQRGTAARPTFEFVKAYTAAEWEEENREEDETPEPEAAAVTEETAPAAEPEAPKPKRSRKSK